MPNDSLMETVGKITLEASRDMDLKRENANIDGDTSMGSMLRVGSETYKEWCKKYQLNPQHAKAHDRGDIHIHDLDFAALTTTCTQIDIKKLFSGGFNTGHGFLREPNSIECAAALACIAIQSNQNDQHGGQSIPAFDYGLAPAVARSFIKNICLILDILDYREEDIDRVKTVLKNWAFPSGLYDDFRSILNDEGLEVVGSTLIEILYLQEDEDADRLIAKAMKKTDRDTYQAMESLVHNLNTMHARAGAQVPFSSINYGTDTSPEGRMVIRNILLAEDAGLGNGETPIFPIHIFKLRSGYSFNPGDPNYDLFKLSCRVSAKRLFPNWSFLDSPFNAEFLTPDGDPDHEVAYMGCRTRVMANCNGDSTTFGRGNLSFTTINLPRLGIKHKGDVEGFWEELAKMCDLVIDQLLDRFEVQAKRKVRNYPFLMGQAVWRDSDDLGPDDEVREPLEHGTLTIGFIGLAECLKALIGYHHGENKEALALGHQIVRYLRERCDEATLKYNLNFSLIATPAEGLSGRFVKIDREIYGAIPGVTDRDYYTNSFHVPVYFPITAFKKIATEGPFHEMTNGGHISYVEVDGNPQNNIQAVMDIVRYMGACGFGYGSINHPVDRDPMCGYTGIIGDECPRCGRTEKDGKRFERIRRITGYLVGTLDRFNNGKAAEERDRVKHFKVTSLKAKKN